MSNIGNLKGRILQIVEFTRFRHWVAILQENLVASFLLLLLIPFNGINNIFLLIFVIMQIFFLTYAFVVNDFSDRDIDIKAGKFKPIHKLSKQKIALVLCLLIGGFLIIPLYFGNLLIDIILLILLFFATFYSLKPIRFKERGILAIIVADIAQRSVPFLILGLWVSASPVLILFFVGWLFMIGFQDELGHQLADLRNDEKSDTHTWARRVGYEFGEKTLIAFLVLSVAYLFSSLLIVPFYDALGVSIILIVFRFVGEFGKGIYSQKIGRK